MSNYQPMQPIILDKSGVARFKENKVVRYLLDRTKHGLNELAVADFPDEDYDQFLQMLGYSVSGIPMRTLHTKDAAVRAVKDEIENVEQARIAELEEQLRTVKNRLSEIVGLLYGVDVSEE